MHPYRQAWETRDLDAWREAMAPDVVLHSPIFRTPFVGRDRAVELFAVLFETFPEVEFTEHFSEGSLDAFFWKASYRGHPIDGADLIRLDDQGRVADVRVYIRPLVNIAHFAAAAGPPLAAERVSRRRGTLVRVISAPLRPLFATVDRIASRLIRH